MARRHVDVLLVGGGVAAARCARTLRRGRFDGSILLVGEESLPPYNRPPLSKELLRDELPEELLLAEPEAWYPRRGVELALGTRVERLDPEARVVLLADGSQLGFGRCLLATGAAPLLAPIPGAENALLLRTLDDARALRARAVAGERAVVIGGGFIGVEVAASLAVRGMDVTVLELAGGLWGGTLGAAVSDWAIERLRRVGVVVRLATTTAEVGPAGVRLAGEWLGAELVVMGVGVRPRVDLAEAAGLEVDDGVLVDDGQATSSPAALAAGDVARPRGTPRVEHWHAARESGERAALAMLGERLPPRRAPWVFSEFGGAHLDVVGAAGRGAEEERAAGAGVHAWLHDGKLQQVAILDHALPVEEVRSLVQSGASLAQLRSVAAGR